MSNRPSKTASSVEDEPSTEAKPAEAQPTGHLGYSPDPTPNEHYTVAGVLAGKPTPETDAALAAEARTSIEAR